MSQVDETISPLPGNDSSLFQHQMYFEQNIDENELEGDDEL